MGGAFPLAVNGEEVTPPIANPVTWGMIMLCLNGLNPVACGWMKPVGWD